MWTLIPKIKHGVPPRAILAAVYCTTASTALRTEWGGGTHSPLCVRRWIILGSHREPAWLSIRTLNHIADMVKRNLAEPGCVFPCPRYGNRTGRSFGYIWSLNEVFIMVATISLNSCV